MNYEVTSEQLLIKANFPLMNENITDIGTGSVLRKIQQMQKYLFRTRAFFFVQILM